jgi:hypothetical protein
MNRLATVVALSATVLIFGCGGAPGPAPIVSPSTSPTAQPPVTPSAPKIAGNWQFSATSTVPGKPPLTFGGSIGQTDSAASGALHIGGSNCFNQLSTVGLTGTVTADSTSLTSTALDGQIVTFTGNFTNTTFTGTYSINGGCDAGDQGSVTGINIPYLANNLAGTFTNSAQATFNVTGNIAQSASAGPEGSFEITGTVTFDIPCFNAATIKPGAFPSGSFILGTSVAFEFDTSNSTLIFLGTLSQDRSQINGSYVASGACNDSGTAVLNVTSPWDY